MHIPPQQIPHSWTATHSVTGYKSHGVLHPQSGGCRVKRSFLSPWPSLPSHCQGAPPKQLQKNTQTQRTNYWSVLQRRPRRGKGKGPLTPRFSNRPLSPTSCGAPANFPQSSASAWGGVGRCLPSTEEFRKMATFLAGPEHRPTPGRNDIPLKNGRKGVGVSPQKTAILSAIFSGVAKANNPRWGKG